MSGEAQINISSGHKSSFCLALFCGKRKFIVISVFFQVKPLILKCYPCIVLVCAKLHIGTFPVPVLNPPFCKPPLPPTHLSLLSPEYTALHCIGLILEIQGKFLNLFLSCEIILFGQKGQNKNSFIGHGLGQFPT